MNYYERVWQGLQKLATTLYSLEMSEDSDLNIKQVLNALLVLAEKNKSRLFAVRTVKKLRNSLSHQIPTMPEDHRNLLPDWADLFSASNTLVGWLRSLKARSLSSDADFESYIFWAEYICNICELCSMQRALGPRRTACVLEAPATPGIAQRNLSQQRVAPTRASLSSASPSFHPGLGFVRDGGPSFDSAEENELKGTLTKGSRVLILTGKYKNRLASFNRWNGTTVYVDIDGLGTKIISRKIQLIPL